MKKGRASGPLGEGVTKNGSSAGGPSQRSADASADATGAACISEVRKPRKARQRQNQRVRQFGPGKPLSRCIHWIFGAEGVPSSLRGRVLLRVATRTADPLGMLQAAWRNSPVTVPTVDLAGTMG
jgi:hypothetical protein